MVVSTKFFSRPKKKKLSLFELARLHDNVCQYCLNRYPVSDLTIDHVHPRSKGGTDDHSNRVLACRPCNSRKGSKTPWFNVNGEVPAAPLIPAISSLILNKNKISMSILASLIKSLELFLSLKNKLFYYDIREKSKKRQNEIIEEIEKLRSRGDSNSADRADLLRSELSREKSELEHLSTFYSKASERSKDSNA
jgi:hypothetical protein